MKVWQFFWFSFHSQACCIPDAFQHNLSVVHVLWSVIGFNSLTNLTGSAPHCVVSKHPPPPSPLSYQGKRKVASGWSWSRRWSERCRSWARKVTAAYTDCTADVKEHIPVDVTAQIGAIGQLAGQLVSYQEQALQTDRGVSLPVRCDTLKQYKALAEDHQRKVQHIIG